MGKILRQLLLIVVLLLPATPSLAGERFVLPGEQWEGERKSRAAVPQIKERDVREDHSGIAISPENETGFKLEQGLGYYPQGGVQPDMNPYEYRKR